MSAGPLYHLTGVQRCEGERCLLDLPDLELAAGGITAVVGPNGAGKSTLLRLLALLDPPQQGEVRLRGATVDWSTHHLVSRRREITLVQQVPYLFHGSVSRNVAFGLRVRGVPRRDWDPRVRRALEHVGLGDCADQPARSLSGGEVRRLSLARALVVEPRVLLLDEPFANVDRHRVERLERLVNEINLAAGTTVIFSTHDQTQAHRLAERVLCLDSGRLVPEDRDNLFAGTLAERGGRTSLPLAGGTRWLVVASGSPGAAGLYTVRPADVAVAADAAGTGSEPGPPAGDAARQDGGAPPPADTRPDGRPENRLAGRIVRLDLRGDRARLRVEAGELFRVEIPLVAVEELGLTLGGAVVLSFPAAAVRPVE